MASRLNFSFLIFTLIFALSAHAQFRVIGYYPTWVNYPNGIKNVDLAKLTHINIAFANPNVSGILIPADGTNASVTTIVDSCHAKNVKVFMSIGGAGAPGTTYKNLLSSATNINSFVANIVNYAVTYNLDGIDVDIEGDVLDGSTVTAAQYQSFVTALAIALHAQSKQMSAALASWFASFVTNTAAAQFDWISIMSYDNAIPPNDPAGPHAPYSGAVSDFQYWNTTKAVPGAKLNIGVPFYGYGWGTYADPNNNEIPYCTIVSTYAGAENNDIVGSGSNAIYYNGIPTIKQKTSYAMTNGGGIMIWEITEDCISTGPKSLLAAIDQVVHGVTAISSSRKGGWEITVFPNPVSNDTKLELNLAENSRGSLLLCDLNGKILEVITEGVIPKQASFIVSMSQYPEGLYMLKLDTEQGSFYHKISK
ncbi:MAG TPA: glycosyl hydrolase family 18 protein [Cytophagaceae bacterium]|jgi:chitinase|nr:glycosyl hydrolase family 18 protein [Cytophagaceae bacterium]